LMEPSGNRSLFPMCTNVRSCSTRPLKQKCSSHYYSSYEDSIHWLLQHTNTVQSECLWSNGTDKTVTSIRNHFQYKMSVWFQKHVKYQ
jgi:hypothetical protein